MHVFLVNVISTQVHLSYWYFFFRLWQKMSLRNTSLTSANISRGVLRLITWRSCTRKSMLQFVLIPQPRNPRNSHQRNIRGVYTRYLILLFSVCWCSINFMFLRTWDSVWTMFYVFSMSMLPLDLLLVLNVDSDFAISFQIHQTGLIIVVLRVVSFCQ